MTKQLTFKEIRQAYIEFFEARAHKHKPSSSLVPPAKDKTVLLTTAGMLQFKPIFMGVEKPADTRVTTVQKCFRTTDLDNVGRTARHHTFFQMLGNFSFGDYFKEEVIPWAWEFLTVNMGLPKEKLWVSVFTTDDEAFAIWRDKVGVPADRIVRLGEADNFWAAGPTGPCGPCSEIYYDLGPAAGNGNPACILGEDDDRFFEVWNLVFMEFNRDEHGVLTPLPAKNIDTGMGLERLAAVVQGVPNNFETDMLFPVLKQLESLTTVKYNAAEASDVSLKLMTDHVRASSFLIADGVVPSNEGRGYVLRRIIRRAFRHGRMLGIEGTFLHTIVPMLVDLYGDFYGELKARQQHVMETLLEEERRFSQTIDRGMGLLDEALKKVAAGGALDGRTTFELYDTYGFPAELTLEVAVERGYTVDMPGFEAAMEEQRDRARADREARGVRFEADEVIDAKSEFLGYDRATELDTVADVLSLGADRDGIILNRTPFYAESGGQVGDTGALVKDGEEWAAANPPLTFADHTDRVPFKDHVVAVQDTQKKHGAIVHVVAKGHGLSVGDRVVALVDDDRRWHTRRHHSATHLLHAALRDVLGTHVAQAGSLVGPDYLRFDFSHPKAVTPAELAKIEAIVNEKILENTPVHTDVMDFEAARTSGAMALFDEKYGDTVRVLSMGGPFSKELCGGTHVRATGDIGLFKITSEGGIAAGVRRIEGVTGMAAYGYVRSLATAVAAVGDRLKAAPAEIPDRLDKLQDQLKASEKQLAALRGELAAAKAGALLAGKAEVAGIAYVAASLDDMTGDQLRAAATSLQASLGSGVIVLAGAANGKVSAVTSVSDDLTGRVKAGEVLQQFMGKLGGKGSGKANFAQGGGGDVALVGAAIADVPAILQALATQVGA